MNLMNTAALWKILMLAAGIDALTATTSVSSCSASQYFDTRTLKCIGCPQNTVPSLSKLSCQCAPGYFIQAGSTSFMPVCVACPPNQGVSKDQTTCMPCDTSNGKFDETLKNCVCNINFYVVETDTAGKLLTSKQCSPCQPSAFPGPAGSRVVDTCQMCPVEGQTYNQLTFPWQCSCNSGNGQTQWTSAGNQCYFSNLTQPISSDSKQIDYKNVETANQVDGTQSLPSGVLNYYYSQAVIGCQTYKDPKQCQTLANLCVLNLYNQGTASCKQFQSIVKGVNKLANAPFYADPGWQTGLPWLYYQQPADQVIFASKRVQFRASFQYQDLSIGIVNQLQFKLATYKIDGTFLGFSDLTDQLVLCSQSQEELNRLFLIGTTETFACTYDLSNLISTNSYEVPRKANLFYELYLVDYNGNLVDIPILIDNIIGLQGDSPNQSTLTSSWILTRRFFLFDTISGVTVENYPNGAPTVIRYAKTFTLKINLDTTQDEMIYVPYLYIQYRERTASYINQNALSTVSFSTQYMLETTSFWKGASATFYVFIAVFALILIIVVCVQYDRPQLETEITARFQYLTVKSLMSALDVFSTLFFWYLFVMTGYWFIFFKLQERVYCFLPDMDTFYYNYQPYDILFGLVCSSKLVFVTFKIYFEQSSYDIFLIDWERPKFQEHSFNDGGKTDSYNRSKFDVNAWRSLFLLNELNELQTYKLISTDFTLLMYALLMEGFGLKYWCSYSPQLEVHDYSSPLNYVLFFFVTTIIIFAVGAAQYLFRYFPTVAKNMPMKHTEFTDLCSITNISVLMFDESFHGYYVHGRSPYGQAEVSQEMLKLALEFEASGKAHFRGVSDQDPDLQTFEIFLPKQLMNDYRSKFYQEVEQKIQNTNTENTRLFNAVQRTLHRAPAIPIGLNIEEIETSRRIMNKIMMKYVEQVRMSPNMYIRDRSWVQRLLNRAPSSDLDQNKPVMFKDNWGAFSNTMLMGMDWDFLMLDCVIITFMERETIRDPIVKSRVILAVLVAFILDHILFWMRGYFGRRNLSKHTLADEAFLI